MAECMQKARNINGYVSKARNMKGQYQSMLKARKIIEQENSLFHFYKNLRLEQGD